MVLNVRLLLAALCLIALPLVAAPAGAHREHNELQALQQNGSEQVIAMSRGMSMEHQMTEEERPTTFSGRLVDFLGRMHPFAVHFPIALIPASWLALVLARRRGQPVDVIRAVIILAGIAAVGAALLGWFNAGFVLTDRDPIETGHRWIGTLLAVLVGAIGLWAWRQTDSMNSRSMTWLLGVTTLVLLVQGWLGATLTHGVEHMMF